MDDRSFVERLVTVVLPSLVEIAAEPSRLATFASNVKTRVGKEGLPYVQTQTNPNGWTLEDELERLSTDAKSTLPVGARTAQKILQVGSVAAGGKRTPIGIGLAGTAAAIPALTKIVEENPQLGVNPAWNAPDTKRGRLVVGAQNVHPEMKTVPQLVSQYRKAFRPKSGESNSAMRKRMEDRIPGLIAAGKLRVG